MAKSPSPFAGMKLTEQTPLKQCGLDQKLFSRPNPLPDTPDVPAPKPPAKTPANPPTASPMQPAATEAKEFDLNIPTEKSETFAFTFEEWLAIDQLKTELTRLLGVDLRVTKIDIIRCALHMIVKDYRAHGAQSFLFESIKNKKPVDRIRRKKVR